MASNLIDPRAQAIFAARQQALYAGTDALFFWLLLLEWGVAIILAGTVTPYTWVGRVPSVRLHVSLAVGFGAVINAAPLALIRLAPGRSVTRQAVAIAQVFWSAVLIHLTGGRIETHFHIFGSLAFLAFYRDWKVLLTATLVVAGDHLVRGLFWPESIYGMTNPEWWRFAEHVGWVVFEDIVLILGCRRGLDELEVIASREAQFEAAQAYVEATVRARTSELAASADRYRSLVEGTDAIPFEIDVVKGRWAYLAPQATQMFHLSIEELTAGEIPTSGLARLVAPEDRDRSMAFFQGFMAAGALPGGAPQTETEVRYLVEGFVVYGRTILCALYPGDPMRGIIFDISRQKRLEADQHQAQKLELVGRLASGVAHEINTPVQFMSDSVHFVRDAMRDVCRVLEEYHALRRLALEGAGPLAVAAARTAGLEMDAGVDFAVENVPKALERAIEGLARVTTIVRSMKEFAHPDRSEMAPADLNQAIRNTLVITHNEYNYVADVETSLGDLPSVVCQIGQLNQVVLNLVVNVVHSIGDQVRGTDRKGKITVGSRLDGEWAEIAIADTGGGIPKAIRGRVFDPFFTTKEVGKGTGQGWAIAHSVVVDKHGGELRFETEVGQGTTFLIRVPVASRDRSIGRAEREAA